MTEKLVPLIAGAYAIMFDDRCGSYYGHGTLQEEAASLVCGTVNEHALHRLLVVQVDRVMPKTFVGRIVVVDREDRRTLRVSDRSTRFGRGGVIGSAPSRDKATDLQRRILNVGRDADRDIEREAGPILREIETKHRVIAMAQLRALLPDLLGKSA